MCVLLPSCCSADATVLAALPEAVQAEARSLQASFRHRVGGIRGSALPGLADDDEEDEGDPTMADLTTAELELLAGGTYPRRMSLATRGRLRGHPIAMARRTGPTVASLGASRRRWGESKHPDASPQVDEKGLCILLRLLRLGSWTGRSTLHRLFTNLAASPETRTVMARLLLALLRPAMSLEEAEAEGAQQRAEDAEALAALCLAMPKDPPDSKGVLNHNVIRRVMDVIHHLCM